MREGGGCLDKALQLGALEDDAELPRRRKRTEKLEQARTGPARRRAGRAGRREVHPDGALGGFISREASGSSLANGIVSPSQLPPARSEPLTACSISRS
jgi:hypothetical protein